MSKPQDYFKYQKDSLRVDGVSIEKIADSVGTPFYVYSAKAFLDALAAYQKGLKGLNAQICFAVKSNSNIAILQLLKNAGAGLDLVSGGELFRASLADYPGDRLVFSGVGKTPGEMAAALLYQKKGILSFNVESSEELATLNAVALDPEIGCVAPVALRFNPDVNPKTHPYISTGLKKNKFGLNYDEVIEISKKAKNLRGIKIRGISIHIGSQLLDLKPLKEAFFKVRDLALELNEILPEPLEALDLGGGLGISYQSSEKCPTIPEYCETVKSVFAQKDSPFRKLQFMFEPGRRVSGNAGALICETLYRKSRKDKDFLIIDGAMNDLLRPSLYGSHHEIIPVKKSVGKPKKTDIVGPVCESGDCFAHDRMISSKISQGDLVAVLSAGAYGFVMSGNYNSRPRVPEVLVQNGKFRVIRERESYEDLVRGESL